MGRSRSATTSAQRPWLRTSRGLRALHCQPRSRPLKTARRAARRWERAIARELLPAAWVGDAARGFGDDQGAVGGVPPSKDAVVALVADLNAILTVEALLAECAARMAPWGVAPLLAVWQEGYVPLLLREGLAGVLVPPLADNSP